MLLGFLLVVMSTLLLRSPNGIKHEIEPKDYYGWCSSRSYNYSNFLQLAGRGAWNTSVNAAAHVKGWTRDEDMLVLKNNMNGELLLTVGATYGRDAGKHFQRYLSMWRPDINFSSEQWKNLFKGKVGDLQGWSKVPKPANIQAVEVKQLAQVCF